MTPAVDKLVTLITPPPTDVVIDWDQAQDRLGHRLPDDYKSIADTYGAGLFGGEVAVWLPDGHGGEDIFVESPGATEILTEFGDTFRDDNINWVDPDGHASPIDTSTLPAVYTPWGGGTSGAYGYWHRSTDDPNTWPVFWVDYRADLYLHHPGGIAAFITDLVTSAYPTDIVDPDITQGPLFIPQFP